MDALAMPRTTPERVIDVKGGLRIDPATREVFLQGRPIVLTQKEFDLLQYFAEHPGRVYTRAQLLDAVWGYSHEGYEHAVNCHINRLRAKIEPNPGDPQFLLTAWGVGYKFTTDSTVTG
jgi:DNA-binding response OmpR family regulator